MSSRRDLLAAVGTTLSAGVAGCSSLSSLRPKMDVGVENFRDDDLTVTVKFFRPSVTEYSEALVHEEHFDVSAEGDRQVVREDVLPDRRYRVAVVERESRHFHYRPDCGRDSSFPPGVMVSFLDGGGVRFSQTTCSDDTLFL